QGFLIVINVFEDIESSDTVKTGIWERTLTQVKLKERIIRKTFGSLQYELRQIISADDFGVRQSAGKLFDQKSAGTADIEENRSLPGLKYFHRLDCHSTCGKIDVMR